MKKKTPFFVIIEDNGKFVPYDVMKYLNNSWSLIKRRKTCPADMKAVREWVISTLKYQYWCRCEYEWVLTSWPPRSEEIGDKWDIYKQCEMNIDLIIRIFIENNDISF